MGGGLMQLVAYGAQDIYLTGNPQITFFKVVYRRHTNFAVESIEQTYNGSALPNSKISVTVSRNGDLISQVFCTNTFTGNEGHGISSAEAFSNIESVDVEIGGQIVDKHYGHWMQIWTDLSHNNDSKNLLNKATEVANGESDVSYVPLQLWFCRNPGLALPLIALQYHEVKINITLSANAIIGNGGIKVWCDYVFLDTDERRRFAQVSHEYLIEQVQYSNALSVSGTSTQHELRFNHPVKELVWTIHDDGDGAYLYGGAEGDTNVSGADKGPLMPTDTDIKCSKDLIQLNGHDRFKAREGKYFTVIQRYQHHKGSSDTVRRPFISSNTNVTGGSNNSFILAENNTAADSKPPLPENHNVDARADVSIPHVYSFALKPEDHQPSGTCNFSRIDNAVINIEHANIKGKLRVYAINYNVLRIMSGMGGLAYSN